MSKGYSTSSFNDRCFCYFMAAMLVPMLASTNMASSYKALLISVKHFSELNAWMSNSTILNLAEVIYISIIFKIRASWTITIFILMAWSCKPTIYLLLTCPPQHLRNNRSVLRTCVDVTSFFAFLEENLLCLLTYCQQVLYIDLYHN